MPRTLPGELSRTFGWSGWWTRPHSADHRKRQTPQYRRLTYPSWCHPRQRQPLVEMRLEDHRRWWVGKWPPPNPRHLQQTTEYGGDPLSQVIRWWASSGSQSKDSLTKKAYRERFQCCSTVSRSLLDECFDGQGNLIDNPGTSVTTFDMLKSAAEQVSKRMKHKDGRPKRSWVEHHSILRNRLVSYKRRRRETHKISRKEGTAEWDVDWRTGQSETFNYRFVSYITLLMGRILYIIQLICA